MRWGGLYPLLPLLYPLIVVGVAVVVASSSVRALLLDPLLAVQCTVLYCTSNAVQDVERGEWEWAGTGLDTIGASYATKYYSISEMVLRPYEMSAVQCSAVHAGREAGREESAKPTTTTTITIPITITIPLSSPTIATLCSSHWNWMLLLYSMFVE